MSSPPSTTTSEEITTTKKLRATFERQKYQDYKGDGWFCYICKVAYQYTCECPKHGSERGQTYWLVIK